MPSDPIRRLLEAPPDLPVVGGLADLESALSERGVAVVQAPPGTGKTTLVPPAVADLVERSGAQGRVVVTQPRRIAARSAARRLASLLGERVGETVGHTVRGDRAVGRGTRIEFVTTGVLLRRLQRDPDLPGVAAVVLDEVHERQLDADLTLAFLLDVRATVRDDLLLVAMSATVEAGRTADVMAGDGEPVPVVDVPGALHPVTEHWSPPPPGVLPVDERGVPPRFLDHVAATVRQALSTDSGDALVFLPGVGEVDGVVRRLSGLDGVDVLPLHGRLPVAEQDRALAAGVRRRVVVSTAVAESSLTVPGVRIVVDAGLSREPRTDQSRGLPALVTVRVSRSAAAQRAGRAGREGPGAVHRCWSRAEHGFLSAHPAPEIAVADLTAFCLELAVWGDVRGDGLALLDPPPEHAVEAARATLLELGALDERGVVTARGRIMAQVPVDPRLARALLDGAEIVGARRAAEVVALLDADVRAPGGDLVAALRSVRRGGPEGRSWSESVARLESLLGQTAAESSPRTSLTDDLAVGTVVALAHPGRIARRRPGGSSYLMVSGTGASFRAADTTLTAAPWIAIADVERRPGARDATIRSAAPIDEDTALEAASSAWRESDEVQWADGVVARRVTRLGAIELSSVTLPDPSPAAVASAVADGLARDGLDVLPWSENARALRRRLAFLHHALGDPWPDVGDVALLDGLDGWLGPDLARVRRGRDLARLDVLGALRRLLPWPAAARLDELAPERIVLPGGRTATLEYGETGAEQPVLPVKIQDAFGWSQTPRVADGRVPVLLHLLTPARRPAAVTADLASFWVGPYRQVRAELRGRYPKHDWPEDPTA